MRTRLAAPGDLAGVSQFYREVCEAQASDAYGPGWHYGIYPSEDDLAKRLEENALYLCLEGERIAAAFVLSMGEDELYREARWSFETETVFVLHLFAVHPAFRGKGVGRCALSDAIRLAAERGGEAVHLDVVKGNLSAERLYRAAGFAFCEEKKVFYVDTGEILVELFEYDLRRGRIAG